MKDLVVKPVIGAVGTVAFLDEKGRPVDGRGGVDSMVTGFDHPGERCRLPESMGRVLALIAEHGGRWLPASSAFGIRPDAVPDFVLACRALPEREVP